MAKHELGSGLTNTACLAFGKALIAMTCLAMAQNLAQNASYAIENDGILGILGTM
jgi:hypothetical protein